VAYGLRWWHDRNGWRLTSRASQRCGQNRDDAFHWHSPVAHRPFTARKIVIPGRRATASPGSIFQRLVFIDSGLATFSRAPE
jgi:hypothetical protein